MFERVRVWMRYGLFGSSAERRLGWREFLSGYQNFYDLTEPWNAGKIVSTPEELAVEALETARREASEAVAAAHEVEQALAIDRESYRTLRAAAEQSEEPAVRAELSAALAAGREVAAAARVAAKRAAEAQKRVASLEAAQAAPLVAALEASGIKDGEAAYAASKTWDQHRAEAGWSPEERMAEQRLREAEQRMAIFTPGSEAEWARAMDDLTRARARATERLADVRMEGAEVITDFHIAGAYAAVADRPQQEGPQLPEQPIADEPEVPWYRQQGEYASAIKESLDASEKVEEVAPQVPERPVEVEAERARAAEIDGKLARVDQGEVVFDLRAPEDVVADDVHETGTADPEEVGRRRAEMAERWLEEEATQQEAEQQKAQSRARRLAAARRFEEMKHGLGPQL